MNLPPEYENSPFVKEPKEDKDDYDERLDDTNPFINEPVNEPKAD